MAEHRRRAAVVGASLGGLSAAQVLQDSGFAVTVFEKHGAPFSDRGGGLSCNVPYDEIRPRAPRPPPFEMNALTREHPDGPAAPCSQPAVAYGRLWDWLRDGVADLRLGAAVADVVDGPGGAHIVLAGGADRGPYDLVVLADGGRSTLRRRVDATATPTYSGFCLYRGLAPLAALGGRADGTFFLWQHGDKRLDGYAVGPALNWGVTAPAPEPRRRRKGDAPPHAYAGAGDADVDAAVAAAAAAFPTPWPAAVVAATAAGGRPVVRHPLYHLAAARASRGRLALLGDAAHLFSPLVGSGLRAAMLDAIALKACLAAGGDVAAALGRYDAATRAHRFDFAARSAQALAALRAGARFRLPLARPVGGVRAASFFDAARDDPPDVDLEPDTTDDDEDG
jgi:2-polyprenyl-6-methoxyphenol hydroxylase-like FAD-dependent oxidoreductase